MFIIKSFGLCIALATVLSLSGTLYAKDTVSVLSEEKRVEYPDREKMSDLREYGFWERKARFGPGDNLADAAIYYSTIYAWYETDSIKNIEEYAFVRYIKGCAYVSTLNPDGVIDRGLGVTRQHLGERIVFIHPEWEIDSDEVTPMYGSVKREPLLPHYFMEWGVPRGVFPDKSYSIYGEDPPVNPRLYFHARNSVPAYLETIDGRTMAINHSFEQKVCLYRTKDIPATAARGMFIENPVDCFSWSNSFIYDHFEKKFRSQRYISGICSPEIRPSAEKKWELGK